MRLAEFNWDFLTCMPIGMKLWVKSFGDVRLHRIDRKREELWVREEGGQLHVIQKESVSIVCFGDAI